MFVNCMLINRDFTAFSICGTLYALFIVCFQINLRRCCNEDVTEPADLSQGLFRCILRQKKLKRRQENGQKSVKKSDLSFRFCNTAYMEPVGGHALVSLLDPLQDLFPAIYEESHTVRLLNHSD